MELTNRDKKQVDNLIRIMSRAKMELEGVEVLAAADAMKWLSEFQKRLEVSLSEAEIKLKAAELEKLKTAGLPAEETKKKKKA